MFRVGIKTKDRNISSENKSSPYLDALFYTLNAKVCFKPEHKCNRAYDLQMLQIQYKGGIA